MSQFEDFLKSLPVYENGPIIIHMPAKAIAIYEEAIGIKKPVKRLKHLPNAAETTLKHFFKNKR